MEFSVINVIFGFLLIFVFVFTLALLFNAFFARFVLKEKVEIKKFIKTNIFISFGWIFSLALGLMFFSNSGNPLFGVALAIMIFLLTFIIVGKTMKLENRDKVLYSIILAVIINPVWYFLLVY